MRLKRSALLSLLVSSAVAQALRNPGSFSSKLIRRLKPIGINTPARSPHHKVPVLGRTMKRLLSKIDQLETIRRSHAALQLLDRIPSIVASQSFALPSDASNETHQSRPAGVSDSFGVARNTASHSFTVLVAVSNSFPFTSSGASIRTHELFKAMAAKGINIHVVTRVGYPVCVGLMYGARSGSEVIDGVNYHRILPALFPLSEKAELAYAARRLALIGQETGADLVQAITPFFNGTPALVASRMLQVPFLYEVRGREELTKLSERAGSYHGSMIDSDFFALAVSAEERVLDSADHVIFSSRSVANSFSLFREGGIRNYSFAPNGVDAGLERRNISQMEARSLLGLPAGSKIVGSVTSLVAYEGLEYLLTALRHLPESWIVLIVGDGQDLQRLSGLTQDLQLSERTIFAGPRPHSEIDTWYRALDVFALPRIDTAVTRHVTPLKALLAQLLSIPVVCSDLPAIREVTGEHAIFVEPESARALAEGVLQAQQSPLLPAKEFALSRSWDEVAETLVDTYASALRIAEE